MSACARGQDFVYADGNGTPPRLLVHESGYEDDGQIRANRARLACHIYAGQATHVEVGEQQIECHRVDTEGIRSLRLLRESGDREASLCEQPRNELDERGVIVKIRQVAPRGPRWVSIVYLRNRERRGDGASGIGRQMVKPDGRQVVVMYFGAKWCKPCELPAMKNAIARMNPLADKALPTLIVIERTVTTSR